MSIRKDIKDEYSYSVNDSGIHGKGVFAKDNIKKDKKSLACILTDEDILYSDLGKYINHSKSPNCKLVDDGSRNFLVVTFYLEGMRLKLMIQNTKASADDLVFQYSTRRNIN